MIRFRPLFALLLALLVAAPAAALDFPALGGRVVDEAGVIEPEVAARLDDKLEALEAKTTDQLVVVTLASLQGSTIEDFGVALGRHWGIGQAGKDNGALLIVAPNEREVRIEVGYGLEGDLTDAVTHLIVQSSILPRFRAGDLSDGIERGVDDIIAVLSGDADAYKERAAQRPDRTADDIVGFIVFLFILFVAAMVITGILTSGGGPASPGGFSWGGSSGGFSGGSSGGGFSGGGGSFGGGGSSGRW